MEAEIHEVDIDKAQSAMKFMADYVEHNREDMNKVEAAAKEPLMGLILTSIETGLVKNGSQELLELRMKIFMAFDIGYVYGHLGAGKVQK